MANRKRKIIDLQSVKNFNVILEIWCVLQIVTATVSGSDNEYYVDSKERAYKVLHKKTSSGTLATVPLCYIGTNDSEIKPSSADFIQSKNRSVAIRSATNEMLYEEALSKTGDAFIKLDMLFELFQVIDVSEKLQSVKLAIGLLTGWKDCRVQWSLNQSTSEILELMNSEFRRLHIFIPEIRLLETTQTEKQVDDLTAIYRNGYIAQRENSVVTLSCSIDVRMYPFDIQLCYLTFESALPKLYIDLVDFFGHKNNHSDVVSILSRNLLGSGRYLPSETWSVALLPPEKVTRYTCTWVPEQLAEDRRACENQALRYRLILRRHPNFQLISLMVPAFLIIIISSCVFLLPTDNSSGKMGLNLTILLSLFMFVQIVYQAMPESSSTLPLLNRYFMACAGLVSASCVYSAVEVMFTTCTRKVPIIVARMVYSLAPILLRDVVRSKKAPSHGLQGKQSNPHASHHSTAQSRHSYNLKSYKCVTWSLVGMLVGRYCFIAHLGTSVAVLTGFLLHGYYPWTNFSGLQLTDNDRQYICEQLRVQNDFQIDICRK